MPKTNHPLIAYTHIASTPGTVNLLFASTVQLLCDSYILSRLKYIAMPDFDTAHVKNIVLLGHSGSGKTTLAESMLFEAGIIHERGSIEEKNTVS